MKAGKLGGMYRIKLLRWKRVDDGCKVWICLVHVEYIGTDRELGYVALEGGVQLGEVFEDEHDSRHEAWMY